MWHSKGLIWHIETLCWNKTCMKKIFITYIVNSTLRWAHIFVDSVKLCTMKVKHPHETTIRKTHFRMEGVSVDSGKCAISWRSGEDPYGLTARRDTMNLCIKHAKPLTQLALPFHLLHFLPKQPYPLYLDIIPPRLAVYYEVTLRHIWHVPKTASRLPLTLSWTFTANISCYGCP